MHKTCLVRQYAVKSVEEAVNGGVDGAVDSDCFTSPPPSGRDATMLCLARKRKEENARQ